MMSDEGDSVLTSYKSPTDTTPAPDDAVSVPAPEKKGPLNPRTSDVKRDPIDPRPVGMVKIMRDAEPIHAMGRVVAYPIDHHDIPEHTEVLDCHTMTRMGVGRVASRYEFGANLSIQYNGQTWRVETWRERAMRVEGELADMPCDGLGGSCVLKFDHAGNCDARSI